MTPRTGAVKAGRRSASAACSALARPRVDGVEHGAILQAGRGQAPHQTSRPGRKTGLMVATALCGEDGKTWMPACAGMTEYVATPPPASPPAPENTSPASRTA